jgi:hypothetical protein
METLDEIRQLLAENARQLAADREAAEQSRKRSEEEMRELRRQVGEITNTLGEFSEYQVLPIATRLFRQQNLPLHEVYTRLRQEDEEGYGIYEVDILLANSTVAVAMEVKNTLRQRDVEEHLERLERMKEFPLKVVRDTDVYGAVAGMIVKKEVEDFATRKGLFVVKPSGDTVEISNASVVKPKVWHTKA